MNDQKLENLLNLALDATDAEREKSLNMNFGYDRRNRIWELIVRYHGDLSGVGERTKEIILLSGGYAIITAEESEIDWISSQPEVEYIEKPVASLETEYCPDCQEKTHFFTSGRAVFLYEEEIRKSVYQFKFHNKREYAGFYVSEMERVCGDEIRTWNPDVIIPIPMYKRK